MKPYESGGGQDDRTDQRGGGARTVAGGMAPSSAGVLVTTLRGILGQAVEDGILPNNAAAKAGRFIPKVGKKVPEFLSPEAAEGLLASAREKNLLIYPAILLGLRAGLRAGEVSGLEWADIDFDAKTLTVRRTIADGIAGPTKGGGGRAYHSSFRRIGGRPESTPHGHGRGVPESGEDDAVCIFGHGWRTRVAGVDPDQIPEGSQGGRDPRNSFPLPSALLRVAPGGDRRPAIDGTLPSGALLPHDDRPVRPCGFRRPGKDQKTRQSREIRNYPQPRKREG